MDPREKQRVFEEAMARHDGWLAVIARSNARPDSSEDLDQAILTAFWGSLDTYDCESSFCLYQWKLRNDLLPILEDIDRELESLRKNSKSRQD